MIKQVKSVEKKHLFCFLCLMYFLIIIITFIDILPFDFNEEQFAEEDLCFHQVCDLILSGNPA